MSTHATIGIANPDGTVDFIYLHSDGYPHGAGDILNRHYDAAGARRLVNLGRLDAQNEIHAKMAARDGYQASRLPEAQARLIRNKYPARYQAKSPEEFQERSLKMRAHYTYLQQNGRWLVATRIRDEAGAPWRTGSQEPLAELLDS